MDDERNTQRSDRLAEMYENCLCAECERVVQYNLKSDNCYKSSPINDKGCSNFIPNKDKV